jgi:glycosyltransferase involved in cell wall biosynthesis
MKKYRLSICIATHNRANYISETLDSIIGQLTEEVEVVVVDGASTDPTPEVVKRYCEACEQIRYFRLDAKGGVDRDFCKAVELAQGAYCWLFSDDDLLKPGAVEAVLGSLAEGYGLVIVNAEVKNHDLTKVLVRKRLRIEADETYDKDSQTQLFQRIIQYISFIGCVVIDRGLWARRDKTRYFGTEFVHVGVIFQSPLPVSTRVLATPYITIRLGNAQWTKRSFEIWMFKWPELIRSFTHISSRARKKFEPGHSWRRFGQVVVMRATGEYTMPDFDTWFPPQYPSRWWRVLVYLIALVPASFVNFLLLPFLRLAGKNSQLAVYCLENNPNNIFSSARWIRSK